MQSRTKKYASGTKNSSWGKVYEIQRAGECEREREGPSFRESSCEREEVSNRVRTRGRKREEMNKNKLWEICIPKEKIFTEKIKMNIFFYRNTFDSCLAVNYWLWVCSLNNVPIHYYINSLSTNWKLYCIQLLWLRTLPIENSAEQHHTFIMTHMTFVWYILLLKPCIMNKNSFRYYNTNIRT